MAAASFAALALILASASAFTIDVTHSLRQQPSLRANQALNRGARSSTALNVFEIADIAFGAADFDLASKSLTSCILSGVGDTIAQKRERSAFQQNGRDKPFDAGRCRNFAMKGLGSGLIWSAWYSLADDWSMTMSNEALSVFPHEEVAAFGDTAVPVLRTVSSLLLDQFVGSPAIYSLWDVPVPLLLSGVALGSAMEQVRTKIFGIMIDNAKVWTLANVVIYNLPLEMRVIAMSITDVFWQSIMSSAISEDGTDAMVLNTIEQSTVDQILDGDYGPAPESAGVSF